MCCIILQVEQGRHCPSFKVSFYCGRVEKTSDKTGEEKGVFQKGAGICILRHRENYINAGGWVDLCIQDLGKGPYTQICFLSLHCNLLKVAALFEPRADSQYTTKCNDILHCTGTVKALFNTLP